MSRESYIKLQARIMGSLNNAIRKDPNLNQYILEKVFYESCKKLKAQGKLKDISFY